MLITMTEVVFEVIALVFQGVIRFMLSRSAELPRQPLAERYVNLSIHTAPIRQTPLPFLFANARINGDTVAIYLP